MYCRYGISINVSSFSLSLSALSAFARELDDCRHNAISERARCVCTAAKGCDHPQRCERLPGQTRVPVFRTGSVGSVKSDPSASGELVRNPLKPGLEPSPTGTRLDCAHLDSLVGSLLHPTEVGFASGGRWRQAPGGGVGKRLQDLGGARRDGPQDTPRGHFSTLNRRQAQPFITLPPLPNVTRQGAGKTTRGAFLSCPRANGTPSWRCRAFRQHGQCSCAPRSYVLVRVCWASLNKMVSVVTPGASRETSPCFSPLPSHSISRIPYHARRRTTQICGKTRALQPRQNVSTQPTNSYEDGFRRNPGGQGGHSAYSSESRAPRNTIRPQVQAWKSWVSAWDKFYHYY